jgi:hypothetical protein
VLGGDLRQGLGEGVGRLGGAGDPVLPPDHEEGLIPNAPAVETIPESVTWPGATSEPEVWIMAVAGAL